jgi:predicted amino acid-binding ACT domain protein
MTQSCRFALSVMCEDKVGLVARLTERVSASGGQVEVLHQGVLQGCFVFMLLVSFDTGMTERGVKSAIESAGKPGEFVVSVMPRSAARPAPAAVGESFVLTVRGENEDASAILKKTTAYLADHRINIEGLTCEPGAGCTVITSRLTIPAAVDVRALRLDMHELLRGEEAAISLVHEDIFAATSRIEMPRRPAAL